MANKKRLVAITLAILMLVMECLSLFSCGKKVENFELSFNVDGENYATITTTGTETIQIPENPSKGGYTFEGWYWDKDVWTKPFTANSLLDAPISSDMSVYAKFTPIAYSISYEMDGGTHNNPATYTIESSFEFANAQKAGYTFLGWYTDAAYTTQIKSISAGTTGDMTLYPKFELATYSITYENTKGAENTNPSTYTINSETITFSPLSKDGYTFGGWYVGDTKVMEISKGSTGNLTLTAKWDTIGYSITYHNVDGATHTNPAFYDVENQPLTLSAASKTGYRFVGWYTDESLTNKVTEIAVGTTGDLDLYAKWEIIEYTATFKDGDTVVGTVKFTVESDSITEPAVPEHTGYTGAWESYTLGTEDITINAVYTLITYNIVYHNVDGANNTNPSNYDVEDQPLALLDASKDYYTFKGWYTDAEFNDKVTEIALGTTGVVNLYAKWEAIEYTATFKDGDTVVGTVKFTVESNSITEPAVPEHTGYTGVWESYTLGTEDITVNAVYTLITYGIVYHNVVGATNTNPINYDVEDQPLALLDASKDYYTFKGWYTDAEFNNKVTEIAVGTTGVVNLYAKWEAVEYTATFMDGDTEVGKVKFTVETESIMPPAVPEHIGYTGAWESYTLGHENITVNAVYTPITYTITYTETKGATNSNVGIYTIESETIILSGLSAVGYTFDGWYDGDTKVTRINKGSIGNLTLTAKWTAIKYSITYLYDHEIGDYADENKNPATYTIEDEFVFIPLVNHTPGYTFDGWFTEKNNGTGDKVTGVALGTTGDITVYAQWGLEHYTITYHNVNGATNTNAENYNVETETFNIEDISRIGYVFDGWYADAEFTTPASTTIVKGSTGNIDMYAKWTPIGYSITYILFGETVDDITNPDRYTIEDSFVLNNPTREGYVFVGWYTLNENGERVTEIKANTTGNQTLYARWIKFESNGGSAVSYTPVHSGNTISAPDAPTRAHYEFDGWYTNEESTQKYNFKPTESITLYAKWIPVEYEIEYILNGGTNSKDNPDTYTVEDKFELCAPDKVGYTFVGWFTDSEFTSTVITEIKAGTSGKITLYAHYLINQYTISFESDGGTTVSAITQNYATDVTAPESPAKNGYEFAGWYSDATLKNAYTFTTMPAEDITLYAKWDIVTYDITYNLDGGTNHRNNPSTYKITSADITLGVPAKTGYTFGGWHTDSACTQAITKIANGSFGDVELFAKWTATVYTVTYNMPSGATQSNAATYTIETNLITLTNATLKGHTFNGWYSDDSYTTPVTTIAGGAINDIVLYAKFTANTYNVWLEGDEEAKHTVSFDLNGAEGTVASQTVTPTATLKYPTIPTRDQYIFAGWYDNAACTGAPYDFTAVVTKDTTLYAKWVKIENASLITINGGANITLNGKTEHMLVFVPLVSGNITITSSGEYDTFGTLYNAEMVALIQNDDGAADGINFHIVYNVTAGETYYIGARAFSSTTTGSATVSISGNTTVLDGGYAITTSQTPITYGTSFTLTLPDARDGYKFLGYADKDGIMYTDANGNSIKTWDKDEDTILYSVWERTVYTVTFVTSGGTPIDTITLAYGDRFDISKYVTTREGYTFNGWYLDGEEYNATTMPDHSITLTAYWKTFALGTIKYDTDKKSISVNDTITPELFDALCLDTNGNLATFTVSISGTQAAGETITVRLTATSGGKTKVVTIADIKVYGAPTLNFDDTVDYVNINGGMTATHFGASGKDTFGVSTKIKVYIDGEYEVGTLVKIVIESIDPAGNITYGYIENVKAYGLPEITYNENKTAISVNDTLNAELFGATAKDSFGEPLTVTVTRYSGTIAAGRTVTIRISATDSKGNVTNIDVQCKVYGMPTISSATKTDVRAVDIVTPELLGITGTDTYGESLTVALTTKIGAQTAGTVWTITATVTDAAGNITIKDFELKVYGTPTISYEREGIKVTEDATTDPATILNAIAKDSFGNSLTVTAIVKSGSLTAGTYIIYTLTAVDHLDNTYSIDTAPIGVYDVNDIKVTYSAGMSDLIKLSSKGEEFDAKATDSFGNLCDITIEAAEGYTLEGGKIITLYIVATDKASNRVLSDTIEEIKVYDIPKITLNQDNRVITEDIDISFLFTVHDSFGEELYVHINVAGTQTEGNTIIVTIAATDDAGNSATNQYAFGVLPSDKPFVELYVEGVFWQALFVDDKNNYKLPMAGIEKDGYTRVWFDQSGSIYTDTNGQGIIELPSHIQLYFGVYKTGYTPICTANQLKSISRNGKHCLASNLDLSGVEWTPIGTDDSPYKGVFDGNGYTINNFTITKSVEYAGLFGYNTGEIKNLGVNNFTVNISSKSIHNNVGGLVGYNAGSIINCYTTCEVSSYSSNGYSLHVGGLVGMNYGEIEDSYSTGSVKGSGFIGGLIGRNGGGTVKDSYASTSVSGTSYVGGLVGTIETGVIINSYAMGDVIGVSYVGGLIGRSYTDAIVVNCYATGSVNSQLSSAYGSSIYAGGFVSTNEGTITNSYATGDVTSKFDSSGHSSSAGGFCGSNNGTITNSYATGYVTSINGYNCYAGGFVCHNNSDSSIKNCYATGNVTAGSASSYIYVGGLVAYNNGTITNCYRYSGQIVSGNNKNNLGTSIILENLQSKEWSKNNLWTAEIEIWNFNTGYPTLNYHVIGNTTVEISTKEQLCKLQGQSLVQNYVLSANLDLGGMNWKPIFVLAGMFNGNGHTISNFKVVGDVQHAGIFGYNIGTIENLGVDNVTINVDADDSYAGGLVGWNFGVIAKCAIIGDVTNSNTSSRYAGGLVGYNTGGTIMNCYTICNVKASASSSSQKSYSYSGGLVGYSENGTIINSYATGDVDAISSSSFDRGSNYANSYAGGLVGCSRRDIVTNCYATGNITASATATSSYYGSGNASQYAGGLVGSHTVSSIPSLNSTITNCYCYSKQTISSSNNIQGTVIDMATLQSVTFYTDTLGWNSEIWNFVNGGYPTLKNVGVTN